MSAIQARIDGPLPRTNTAESVAVIGVPTGSRMYVGEASYRPALPGYCPAVGIPGGGPQVWLDEVLEKWSVGTFRLGS